jgi:hypothetical protein
MLAARHCKRRFVVLPARFDRAFWGKGATVSRAASHRDLPLSVEGAPTPESPALWLSLALLGLGYLLVLLEPVLAQRVEAWSGQPWSSAVAQRWLPAVSAGGLALGGSAALLFVLSRLLQDVARRPYACLAPVLAVFCGFLLCGLRAKLPLSGVASEHVGILALVLAVLGGALVQERLWLPRAPVA